MLPIGGPGAILLMVQRRRFDAGAAERADVDLAVAANLLADTAVAAVQFFVND
jgi:hypothetical protein